MKKEYIVISETLLQSVIRDLISIVMLLLSIGIGVFLKSTALQWVGALFFIISCFSLTARLFNKPPKSAQALANYLYKEHGVKAEIDLVDK